MSYADELSAIDQEMINRSQGTFGTTVSLTPEQRRLQEEQAVQEALRQQQLQKQQYEQKRASLLQKYPGVETYDQWKAEMEARNKAIDEELKRQEAERLKLQLLQEKVNASQGQGLASAGSKQRNRLNEEYIKGLNQQIVELQKSKADAVDEQELKNIDNKISSLEAQRLSLLGLKPKEQRTNTGSGIIRSGNKVVLLTPAGPKQTTLPELKTELKKRLVSAIKTGNKKAIPLMMNSLKKNLPADIYAKLENYQQSIMPKAPLKRPAVKTKPQVKKQIVRKPIPKKLKPSVKGTSIYKGDIRKAKPWEPVTKNEAKLFNAMKIPFRLFKLMYRKMNEKFYSDLLNKVKKGQVIVSNKDLASLPSNVQEQLKPYVKR